MSKEQARLNLISAVKLVAKAMKYDPDQPRDEAGRWTDGGGGGAEGGGGISSESLGGPSREIVIQESADAIRNNNKESAIVIDKDGFIIAHANGTKNEVRFSEEQCRKMENATFIHNHPGNSTFSPDDVLFMSYYNLDEIRVSTKTFDYIMKNNSSQSYKGLEKLIKSEIRNYKKEGNYAFDYHDLWGKIADKAGYTYSRNKR